jgi:hypothetical protein
MKIITYTVACGILSAMMFLPQDAKTQCATDQTCFQPDYSGTCSGGCHGQQCATVDGNPNSDSYCTSAPFSDDTCCPDGFQLDLTIYIGTCESTPTCGCDTEGSQPTMTTVDECLF